MKGETRGWWHPWAEDAAAANSVLFKKGFRTAKDFLSLLITCNGGYRVWINGRFFARGPAHSGTTFKRADQFDVPAALLKEHNEITIGKIP